MRPLDPSRFIYSLCGVLLANRGPRKLQAALRPSPLILPFRVPKLRRFSPTAFVTGPRNKTAISCLTFELILREKSHMFVPFILRMARNFENCFVRSSGNKSSCWNDAAIVNKATV